MYIHPETKAVFLNHSEIRAGFPNVGFGETIPDDAIEFLGLRLVAQDPKPAAQAGKVAVPMPPELDGDEWRAGWTMRDMTADEIAEARAGVAPLMRSVDDAVADRISGATRFAIGYEQREAAARAFKAAGYQGDPTIWIQRFADNAGLTAKAAADLILSQAEALRGALQELEALRMDKYLIQRATADQAESVAAGIMEKIAAVIIP